MDSLIVDNEVTVPLNLIELSLDLRTPDELKNLLLETVSVNQVPHSNKSKKINHWPKC